MAKGRGYIRIWNEKADLSTILSDETRSLLIQYAKIPPSLIETRIREIAKKAWTIESYPCFQKFWFLQPDLSQSISYASILNKIQSGGIFLDLGCGLGQDIRQLVHDGAPPQNLLGLELRQAYVDLGYELYQDKELLESTFLIQSFFTDTPDLTALAGKITIINSGYFMHMWDREKQLAVAKRMISLLSPERGGLITGVHFGSAQAGKWEGARNKVMFLHNVHTLRALWGECARETGTSWDFRCVVEEDESCWDMDSQACHLRWVAERL
ncbi:hypothetical protein BDV19DRAFT_391899 [Aspergillus venezuelensis]